MEPDGCSPAETKGRSAQYAQEQILTDDGFGKLLQFTFRGRKNSRHMTFQAKYISAVIWSGIIRPRSSRKNHLDILSTYTVGVFIRAFCVLDYQDKPTNAQNLWPPMKVPQTLCNVCLGGYRPPPTKAN